jgi:AraC-like DNA-binding protein
LSVVIDTREVPAHQRFELWADETPRVFEPLAVRPAGDAPFAGRVVRHDLGALTVFRLTADASRVTRTTAMIGASDPEWIQFGLLLGGRCTIHQDGRRTPLSEGDFACWASSRPYVIDAHSRHDLLVTYCPEALLRPHTERILSRTATAIPGDRGTGRLVRRFLLALLDELQAGGAVDGAPDVGEGLLDLIRGLYGPQPERGADALHAQVHAFIDAHLDDPRLGPDLIARSVFVSRRSLDRLFQAEGVTVRESIRLRRLERCRRDLLDPRLAGQSILQIASRWGFVSAAHFSRAFRAAYGVAPSDLR